MTVTLLFRGHEPTNDGVWLARNELGGFEDLEAEHVKESVEMRHEAPEGYRHFRITKILADGKFEAISVLPEGEDTYSFQLLIED